MPTSAWDGRQWVTDQMALTAQRDEPITSVIDVGPGEGTYSILGRHILWWAEWVGVEIWAPYVERFMLDQKYDQVLTMDIRNAGPVPPNGPYLILFGDVLEHMPAEDAVALLRFHSRYAAEMYVSVPIVHSPQGECFGNPAEAHLHQWTWDEMDDLLRGLGGTLEGFKGTEVGRWWRRG